MQGTILNIQRFSLHDGPGIRTVVYFKGCPLHCLWCSNPESIRPEKQLGYDVGRCTHCMDCVKHCQYDALHNQNGKLQVSFRNCIACGECIDKCLTDALTIYGHESSTADVMAIVEKDLRYYNQTKGGVTFSGGESFYQKDFLLSLLKACKDKNIHTCIETSGYTEQAHLAEAAPLTGTFLFDYKTTDANIHLKNTRKSNIRIIENLHFLNDMGAQIVLRCIIIPEINDNTNHFRTIAKLSNELKSIIQTDIIPYHDFARSKYPQIGEEYRLTQKSVPADQSERWLDQLTAMGCKNVSIR